MPIAVLVQFDLPGDYRKPRDQVWASAVSRPSAQRVFTVGMIQWLAQLFSLSLAPMSRLSHLGLFLLRS